MKIHRFFLNTGFIVGEMHIRDIEIVHQMRRVLKLREGEECIFFNGAGQEARAVVRGYEDGIAIINVLDIAQQQEDVFQTILYCAILKRENFEIVVQKTTELGVSEIVPIITQRTIKTGIKKTRLEKIATEASEQCGRARIPVIREPILFMEALERAQDHDLVVVLHTHKNSDEIKKRLYKSIGLFVGPEGGFTDEEIAEAKKYNYACHTFSGTVLRAETAAIVGVFWMKEIMGGGY